MKEGRPRTCGMAGAKRGRYSGVGKVRMRMMMNSKMVPDRFRGYVGVCFLLHR